MLGNKPAHVSSTPVSRKPLVYSPLQHPASKEIESLNPDLCTYYKPLPFKGPSTQLLRAPDTQVHSQILKYLGRRAPLFEYLDSLGSLGQTVVGFMVRPLEPAERGRKGPLTDTRNPGP